MKSILYSDLDRTLLIEIDGKLGVSKKNIAAIKKFVDAGNYFGIATGRNIIQAKTFVKDLIPLINLPYVVGNGSILYDSITGEKIFESFIDFNFISNFIKFYKSRNDFILVLATNDDYLVLLPEEANHLPKIDFPATYIAESDVNNYDITKVMAFIHPENFDNLQKDINTFIKPYNMNLEPSEKRFIEIVNKGIDKASGINESIKYLDFNKYKLYTIGDFYNDISMLEIADVSAAPNDADPRVKKIVTHVLSNHDEDAVSEFIELILNEN